MANDHPASRFERLERAASKLRPIEREALRLAAGEGLSIEEIAGRLGIGRAAAERLLARSLARLDRGLELRERAWWKFWADR